MTIRTIQMMGGAGRGGAELFFVRLVEAFARRPDAFAVLPLVRKGGWAAARLRALAIPFDEAPFGGMADLTTANICRATAQAFAPDVVMSWMSRASRFIPQPGAEAWATVARIGGYYPIENFQGRVGRIVTNTEELADFYLAKGWPRERLAVIANFRPAPASGWRGLREETRARLGIPDGATALLVAARLHPVKGYDIALAALAALPGHVRLLALGDGPLRDELRTLADRLGIGSRVHWLGWQEDIGAFAAAGDIWLVPSLEEPMGNSILDAWTYERPLVATDLPGPAGFVVDGENGLLVPPGDAAALKQAIERLIADPRLSARLVAGGAARLERDFSESAIVAQYAALYASLVHRPKAAVGHG